MPASSNSSANDQKTFHQVRAVKLCSTTSNLGNQTKGFPSKFSDIPRPHFLHFDVLVVGLWSLYMSWYVFIIFRISSSLMRISYMILNFM